MAPYVRQRMSYRYNPYSRRNNYVSAPVISVPISRSRGFARSSVLSNGYRRSYGSSRSKWTTFNTRTNPVYPRPEVKDITHIQGDASAPSSISASGLIFAVNDIPQGVTAGTRVGRSVSTNSVYYNYVLNFGTGEVPNAIRHLLVWDRQSNGATPAVADVLLPTAPPLVAPMNLDNRERFVVLSDERVTLSPNGEMIRFCNDYRRINQKSTYDPDVITNIPNTGGLFAYFFSDEVTADNQPTVYGTWRVRYVDN